MPTPSNAPSGKCQWCHKWIRHSDDQVNDLVAHTHFHRQCYLDQDAYEREVDRQLALRAIANRLIPGFDVFHDTYGLGFNLN